MTTVPKLLAALSLLLTLAVPHGAAAATLSVPSGYPTVQAAVDAAVDGDVVEVGPGTYYENLVMAPAKSITLRGLAGAAQTILDGAQAGAVVRVSGPADLTIDGFTIQNGSESGLNLLQSAAPAPTLFVRITNSVITGNHPSAHGGGGGLTSNGAPGAWITVYLTDSQVVGNTAQWGGGAFLTVTHFFATRTRFADNHAAHTGGAIAAAYLGNPDLTNCLVTGNTAGVNGGGIAMDSIGPYGAIRGSVIERNAAGSAGGGLYTNATQSGQISLRSSTIANNTAPAGGGFLQTANGSLGCYNSIVWGNSSPPVLTDPARAVVQYCDTEGGVLAGIGNASADPRFMDLAGGDYRPYADSPVVDGAYSGASPQEFTDMAGVTRPQGAGWDMGAYEMSDFSPPVTSLAIQGTPGSPGYYRSAVVLDLTAVDPSGVREIHVTVNGNETVVAGASASLALTFSGGYFVSYYSVDANGNAEAPTTLPLFIIDTYPPTVTATSPTNGQTNVRRAASVVISFVEPVQAGANLAGAVLLRRGVPVAVTRTVSGTQLTLRPTSALASSTAYTVSIPAGAVVDAAGNPSAATAFGFRTGTR